MEHDICHFNAERLSHKRGHKNGIIVTRNSNYMLFDSDAELPRASTEACILLKSCAYRPQCRKGYSLVLRFERNPQFIWRLCEKIW